MSYDGQIDKNGKAFGKGKLTGENYVYTGSFVDNHIEGVGVQIVTNLDKDDTVRQGEFKQGEFHGKLTSTFGCQ